MGSLSDILTTIQNGVVAANNLVQQTKGTLTNINGQLATIPPSSTIPASSTIPSTFVVTFNGRSSAVLPAQGDYPTSLIPGTNTNDNATAGNIGEFISATVSSGSAVAGAAGATVNVTSIFLTSGDWDARATLGVIVSGTNTAIQTALSTTSLTFPSDNLGGGAYTLLQLTFASGARQIVPVNLARFSLSSPSTVFLLTAVTGSSFLAYGIVSARRPR